jgi:hypothetical protein
VLFDGAKSKSRHDYSFLEKMKDGCGGWMDDSFEIFKKWRYFLLIG